MEISNNFVNMHIKLIQWRSDWFIFYFWTLKGNQNGEISSDTWHIYSNPNIPTICLVLYLAKYLFSNPDILTNNSPLFLVNCHYKIFLKIFRKFIKDNFDPFQPLRVENGILGAHSNRKEAITIVATGCTVSTPMGSIFLRAGWIMRPIKYWYIHYKKVGDQFVRWYVTGISS